LILLALDAAESLYQIIATALQARVVVAMVGMGRVYTTVRPFGGLERVISLLQPLLCFFTVIAFLRWIYLAHKNLPDIGARYLKCSPGWAVGSPSSSRW
jgi:hypothetical protein